MSLAGWIAVGLIALIAVCSAFDRQDSLGNFHGEAINVWAVVGVIVFLAFAALGMFLLGWF